ncbi:NAD(P)-dependent dehydrogenase, short-chain alcohol dehydrogenase family [Loktanella fryxellensis]|uniref:NAD(P)-dependent dehydrogenase, short-chain alcohol dehydrogenase family n=1 Tax=Loktanella fryxellensis TaxID=245187 RepID=A0A1H8ATH5_9RHOB|nr:SDR family oxidoreductase [Loktanella fryxellensis]SEM74091.1 NAD(P)-dependent dehydrogenase, short-chain alcohol dehydrogenase family [Loktanella fryxellensis]
MTATFTDLAGAHVFITGGGSGIGAALTEAFLRQGSKVSFVGRGDYADFAAKMGDKTGDTPLFIKCDVTDTTALHAAMDRAVAEQGPLRVQVNNAATDTRMAPADITVQDWDDQIAINLRHYFFACQKAAALMGKGGSIINFSSASYQIAGDKLAPYIASNAGIIGLTRALARDFGPTGIRVNAISPGLVLTKKQIEEVHTEEDLAAFRERQCLPENLYPGDVPGTALFLASDLSRMMTAQCLFIDGGLAFTG